MTLSYRRSLQLVVAAGALSLLTPDTSSAVVPPTPVAARVAADFDLSDLHLAGAAHRIERGNVELVGPDSKLIAGGAYTPEPVDVTSFAGRFTFRISGGCADGIAAVIQGGGREALGGGGGAIGYGSSGDGEVAGIEHSLAIEIDLWRNSASDFGPDGVDDPKVPHVSLQTRGVAPNEANPLYSLTSHRVDDVINGLKRRVRMSYDDDKLRVFVDGHRRARYSLDLAEELGLADGTAWVGLTAGQGSCSGAVKALRFRLNVTDEQ